MILVFPWIRDPQFLANLHACNVVQVRMAWNGCNKAIVSIAIETVTTTLTQQFAIIAVKIGDELFPFHAIASLR